MLPSLQKDLRYKSSDSYDYGTKHTTLVQTHLYPSFFHKQIKNVINIHWISPKHIFHSAFIAEKLRHKSDLIQKPIWIFCGVVKTKSSSSMFVMIPQPVLCIRSNYKRHYLSEIIRSFVHSYKEKVKSEWPLELHAQRSMASSFILYSNPRKWCHMMSHRLVDVTLHCLHYWTPLSTSKPIIISRA